MNLKIQFHQGKLGKKNKNAFAHFIAHFFLCAIPFVVTVMEP